MAEIVAINRHLKAALFDDGSLIAFASMFDCDGEETADIGEARAAVVEAPNGLWHSFLLSNFEPVAVN